MACTVYSLSATIRRRGTQPEHHVTARIELCGSGKRQHWWFETRVDGKRAGDFERFPFISLERPPLDAALREVATHVAAQLATTPKDLHYEAPPEWVPNE